MNRRTKPSPAQTGYKWVGWEVWDWTLFGEIIYKFSMEFQSWSKWTICTYEREKDLSMLMSIYVDCSRSAVFIIVKSICINSWPVCLCFLILDWENLPYRFFPIPYIKLNVICLLWSLAYFVQFISIFGVRGSSAYLFPVYFTTMLFRIHGIYF